MPSFVARDAFLLALAMPFRPQNRLGLFEIAAALGQSAFAIHHARVGFLAKLLY